MNPSSKTNLNNTRSDNLQNKKNDLSKEKNIQNVIINSTGNKPKKIIKNIVQINPEKIKNLGIADQILAAVRKLDANNDLPSSINIDLSKVKNIKSQNFKIPTIKSKKTLEPMPSTSKASIQPFENNSNINENKDKLNLIKGTLSKFLQGRQNAKLTTTSSTTTKLPNKSSEETKRDIQKKLPKPSVKNKPFKSRKIDDILNNTTEIQEQFLINSILNDSTDEQMNIETIKKENNTNPKKRYDILQKQNVNILNDIILPIKSPPIHQYINTRQRKISESIIQSTNQLEPKVRILHEIKSEKNIDLLTEKHDKTTDKSKEISNVIKNNTEITLPKISPLKNPNRNLYENYDDDITDIKIPSFSDLTSHIIEKWRSEATPTEVNIGTDTSDTKVLPNLDILQTETESKSIQSPKTENPINVNASQIESKTKPIPSSSRRRKILPIGILNIKKHAENLKTSQSSIENASIKSTNIDTKFITSQQPIPSFTNKVTVNINGAQVTNYKPNRKRKISTTTNESPPIVSTTKNKIMKTLQDIEDKSNEKLNFTFSEQEEQPKSVLTTQEEHLGNNSEIINENLRKDNSEIKNNLQQETNCDHLQFQKLEDNNVLTKSTTIIENISKAEDHNQSIEEESLNSLKEVKEEDGVDFLVNLGDTINISDDYNYSSSESELSLDSDNSDFLKKFPILLNDIKTEIILNENDDNSFDNNSHSAITLMDNDAITNDDIESPNYESFDIHLSSSSSINKNDNIQQNQNELSNSFSNFQCSSPTERKPIVIENKILNENEKIDLIYLKNIPCFETAAKSNYEIGQTVLLQPCTYIKSENSQQIFSIAEVESNIISEMENEKNEEISNEIITINQDEYTIEEICSSANEISNMCIIDNVINSDKNDTDNIQEKLMENENEKECTGNNADTKYTNDKLETADSKSQKRKILDSSELNINFDKTDKEISNIKQENIITTDIKTLDNLKSNKPSVKPKRMRGGKINLIPRNKQSIKKPDDVSPKIKNVEEPSKQFMEESLTMPAEQSEINIQDETKCSIKNIEETSKSKQLMEESLSMPAEQSEINIQDETKCSIKNVEETSQSKQLMEESLTMPAKESEINIQDAEECNIKNVGETSKQLMVESLTMPSKESEISIQDEVKCSIELNLINCVNTSSTNEVIFEKEQLQEKNNINRNIFNTEFKIVSPSILGNNSNLFDKSEDLNLEKQSELKQDDQKEEINEIVALNEENSIEDQTLKLKNSDEQFMVNSRIEQNEIDEDISRNSSLNDSLEMEEPFHGFEETELKLINDKMNEQNIECVVSIDENIGKNISNINENDNIECVVEIDENIDSNISNINRDENIECIVEIDESIDKNNIANMNKIGIVGANNIGLIKNDQENDIMEHKHLSNETIEKERLSKNMPPKNPQLLSTDLVNNVKKVIISATKTDKINTEKRSRKSSSNKSETSSNQNLKRKESVNSENYSDTSTTSYNNKKFVNKLSKRRILDTSEDDEDNIPLKKRSIRKSIDSQKSNMHGTGTSLNLNNNEEFIKSATKLNKINKDTEHKDVKYEKSRGMDSAKKNLPNSHEDTKLNSEKLKQKKHKKTKSDRKENDRKKTDKPDTTAKIKKEFFPNDIDQNNTDKATTITERMISPENESKQDFFQNEIKNNNSDVQQNQVNNLSLDEIKFVAKDIKKLDISTTTPIGPKKRGRKPKNITKPDIDVIPVEIQPEILNGTQIKTPTKGRGRKTVDRKIHPRLLLINNRAEIDKEDITNDIKQLDKNEIQCGMCKEVIMRTTWEKHKKNHYGIGWIMGEEGIDLSSHSAVLNALISQFKTGKIKSLSCRLCKKIFASGLGILVHLEMCGLTDKEKREQCSVKCEHCNCEFSRYSLPSHLKICKEYKAKLNLNNDSENDEKADNDDTKIVIGNTGRLKRKSMIKAEDKFKDIDNSEFDVGDFIKSVTSVRGGQFRSWKNEITMHGTATCIGNGCNLKFNTYDEIREHVKICKFLTKSGYRCTRCKYHNNSVEAVRTHILKEHKFSQKEFSGSESEKENYEKENETSTDDDSSGVDENEEEEENGNASEDSDNDDKKKQVVKRIREKSIKSSNKYKQILDITRSNDDKRLFRDWAHNFFKHNYSKSVLFPNIIVNCKSSDMQLDIFEPKNNLSMKFSFSKIPMNEKFNSSKPLMDWMEIEYFKSASFEDEKLIFIGGPITSLKWLPTDNEKTTSQYLAITYKKNYNKFIHSINSHKQKTLILIYKIGLTKEFNNINNIINLEYGITYDDGPIIDIDFLPSGGYIPEINRLGLLSIASTTNNDIIILSLPIKAPQNCDINNSLNLIDIKIGMQLKLKLSINKNDKLDEIYNVTPTKICWSQAKEHNIIVAGYANGFIGIWNLSKDDNLNFMEINDIPTVLPINYFKASNKAITGLDLHYNNNGTRWLIITNIDRNYKIIDIENPCNPIIITEDIVKSFITSTVWPLIWENPCYSTSDELYQSSVQTLNPLIIYYKHRRYSRQSSSINDISFNNWNNIMACGGNNGDFSIEINGKMNLDVTQKYDKKLNSYTDLIRLDGDNIIDLIKLNEPIKFFDKDFRNKYGLIFGPIKYVNFKSNKDLTFLKKTRNPPINMNCYVKINRVCCNNNEHGQQLFAIGYENGFVRILYINNKNL